MAKISCYRFLLADLLQKLISIRDFTFYIFNQCKSVLYNSLV